MTKLTLEGRLSLCVDDEPYERDILVKVETEVDIEVMMERGLLTVDEEHDKAQLSLEGIGLHLSLDAGVLLSRPGVRLVHEIEQELMK